MAENKNIEVGGRLHSIATGNVLAGANEIFDDDKNKKQSQINTETYSLVNDINERLNSLSPDQQSALSVATKATNNEAKLSYYVCETAAATAAKAISATGYILSLGGSIKIKMTNVNTADNATLNINSTGAKALYYAGERASANNTWEAGETVEVYYDGTSYYANSVAGDTVTSARIKDGAVISEKIATSAFDDTLSISGKITPADVVGRKITELKKNTDEKLPSKIDLNTLFITDAKGYVVAKIDANGIHSVNIDEYPNIIESNTFLITDANGFIAVKIDNNGVHTAMTEGKDAIACMVIGENYYPNNTPVRDTDGRITNADVTFSTGVKGNIIITYDGDYAKTIKVKYNKENYNINIDRDNKGNINKVNVL